MIVWRLFGIPLSGIPPESPLVTLSLPFGSMWSPFGSILALCGFQGEQPGVLFDYSVAQKGITGCSHRCFPSYAHQFGHIRVFCGEEFETLII